MNLRGTKVLVTGAGGFIGSHLVERLTREGALVTAFVRYNSRGDLGQLARLPGEIQAALRIVAGDLRDSEAVFQAMGGVQVVFHLGALVSIPYSYLHPNETIETNIRGSLNVLNAAQRHKVERIVHTSSSEVYGTARYVPIDENHPLQGQSPYSASKIGADKIAESFFLSYGLPVATIRPFNTYGPRQSTRAIIPTIIAQALAGEHIHVGSTHPTRDFTFVADTVDAFVRVAETEKAIGKVTNVGSGIEISIKDLIEKIVLLVGRGSNIDVIFDEQRARPSKSEVERLVADNRRARELLGWAPHTSLEQGLTRTISWMSENRTLYKPAEYQL